MHLIVLYLLALLSFGYANTPVAQVGTHAITKEHFDKLFNSFRKYVAHINTNAPTEADKKRFLSELIKGIIVEEEARRLNIRVRPEEIARRLREWGITKGTSEVRNFVKWEILTEKLTQEVGKYVYITYREIQVYYLLNRREFYLPARVKLLRVMVRTGAKAQEVRRQLVDGIVPDDSDYVKVGNERWYSVATLPRMVRKRLPSLKVGSVSEPIRFGNSYIIFKVVDKSGAGIVPFEEAYDMIKEKLLEEKKREEFRKWFREKLKLYRVRVYLDSL